MHSMTYNNKKLSATELNHFVHEEKLLAIEHSFWF